MLREIRRIGLDVIVNPRLTREFLWSDSVVRCSGARERIGSRGIDNLMSPLQERITSRWYTELRPPPVPGEHESISNLRFLNENIASLVPPRRLRKEEIAADLPAGEFAVMFAGAFGPDKRWSIENFAAAARIIAERSGFAIVLCAGPGEEALSERFAATFAGDFVDLVGKTTLTQLADVISRASLLVSNDTAAGHIAAAERCPAVIVTPGNHVGRFFPYPDAFSSAGGKLVSVVNEMPCFGCGWDCVYTDLGINEPKPCIAGVAVKAVVDAATEILEREAVT